MSNRTDGQTADLERQIALLEPTLSNDEIERYVRHLRMRRRRKSRAQSRKGGAQLILTSGDTSKK